MSRAQALAVIVLVTALPASARPRLHGDYLLDVQSHQHRDHEAISTLQLGLADHYASSRLKLDYDLVGGYLHDAISRRSNRQWTGQAALDYRFSRSFSGLIDLSLTQVAAPGVVVENRLDTQTLASGHAGFEWRWPGRGRNDGTLRVQHGLFRHADSRELDADEDRLELNFVHHLSSRTALDIGFSRFDQHYVEAAQTPLDTRNNQWQLGVDKRWARLNGRLFANVREVSFHDGHKDRFRGYGLELGYQANSRHALSLRVARELRQAFRFNTQLGNGLNRLEQAGLVQTDSARLEWNFHSRSSAASLALYRDDFRFINGHVSGPTLQQGGALTMRRKLSPVFSLELTATSLSNDVSHTVTDLTDLSLIYQWLRSRRVDLQLQLRHRSGQEAGQNADDNSLIIQGKLGLIP